MRVRVASDVWTHDGINCKKDADSTDTFEVLRPYHLQRTPFDDLTIDERTYTFTTGSDGHLIRVVSFQIGEDQISERQFIQPQYEAGALLIVAALADGELVDLNVDARRWMREWTQWG
jgi:hypothetical protein